MLSSRYILIICLGGILCTCSYGSSLYKSYPDGKVSEVMEINSGCDFRCRISGNSLIAGAPLRVRIKGVDSLLKPSEAKAFITEALEKAKIVRLKKIEFGSYFRVRANVDVDGNDLGGLLIKKGLAKRIKLPPFQNSKANKKYVVPYSHKSKTYPKHNIDQTVRKAKPLKSLNDLPAGLAGEGFQANMTFEEAIEQIRHSVRPALPIIVLWSEIEENCSVYRDTPIGVEWNGKVSIKKGLELLLMSVKKKNAASLQYYVEDGVITIASSKAKSNKPVLKVYDISELTSSPWLDRNQYGHNNRNSRKNNRRNNTPVRAR